jgi:crotonobetainyl-CoA:carnitine CoA-transferase CaiB-like acyl-CoA transferase
MKQAQQDVTSSEHQNESPLGDLRVLEIGYGIAAPVVCRNLGEFGADAIRVESARRPDSLRGVGTGWIPPSAPDVFRGDANSGLEFTSPGKRSIVLEVEGAAGRAVFRRLIAGADVLIMNMSVDGVAGLGLTYEELRQVNPRLIYMNMAAFGSTEAPYRTFRTWGGNLSALAGVTALVGWPDREPVGMALSFPDYVSALWGTVAVLAAVMRRDETGQGCEVDLAQYEVAVACIGPTVTSAVLGAPTPHATGNRRPGFAPYGVYPSRGDDQWVAITVLDGAGWDALCRVEGLEGLAADARFATLADRLEHQDELDEALAHWTGERSDWEAAAELQRLGVPAGPLLDCYALLADPQLASRNFFRVLPSTRFGADITYGQAVVLSETEHKFEHASPAFGEHTRDILRENGFDENEIDELIHDGVAYAMEYPDLRLERPYFHWLPKLLRQPFPPSSINPAQIVFDELEREYGAPTAEGTDR